MGVRQVTAVPKVAAAAGRLAGTRATADAAGRSTDVTGRTSAVAPGETFYPVTHLANFALPADRGDFGSGAVDVMGATSVLIALVEFGPESVETALFAARAALPLPGPTDFDPNMLQHRISGQAGFQRFCSVAGRAFCVYVVIGGSQAAVPLAAAARGVLAGVRIGIR